MPGTAASHQGEGDLVEAVWATAFGRGFYQPNSSRCRWKTVSFVGYIPRRGRGSELLTPATRLPFMCDFRKCADRNLRNCYLI